VANDYLAMQDRIADEVRAASSAASSDIASQIKLAIQSAISSYQNESFYFNEGSFTFQTVNGQEYYTSSDNSEIPNILSFLDVRITVNNTTYPLTARTFQYIDQIQTNTGYTGDPVDYCTWAQQIRLYPIPFTARTVTVSYIKNLTILSADTDTNAWMTGNAEQLIRGRAKWDLYLNTLKDPENAQASKLYELDAYKSLLGETVGRQSTDAIRPTQF